MASPALWLGVLALACASPNVGTATASVDLADLVERAWATHPSSLAALQRVQAERHRTEATGYWPDPKFVVALNNVPLTSAVDGSPMTGLQFRLEQTIPFPGKLRRRVELQRARAQLASIAPEVVRLDLAREVGRLYFEIHLLDVTAEVYRANDRLLSTFREVADAKYRSGRGRQQDVLRAELSLDELRQRVIVTERRRGAASASLASLIGQPPSWSAPSLVHVPMSTLRSSLTEEELLAMAESHSPDLREAVERFGVRVAAEARADIEAWPDLQVGVAYTVRGDAQGRDPAQGSDFVSVVMGVQVPVQAFRRLPAVRSTVRAEQAIARQDQQSVRLRIREQVASTLEQSELLRRQMSLLQDRIIPATRQTLEVERAAYQVDRDEVLNLLQTELALIGRLIEFHSLHVELEILLIELARTIGVRRADLVEVDVHSVHHEGH